MYLMNLSPVWLKPVVGIVSTIPIRIAYRQCSSYLLPKFEHLLSHTSSSSSTDKPERLYTSEGMFSAWLVSNLTTRFPPSSPKRTPDFLSRRLMVNYFAAIHTSTTTACNLLLDTFSNPDAAVLLQDEIVNHNTETDSWGHAQLKHFPRLDSALRESMRRWSVMSKPLKKKVVHPDGVTLPGDQHLPQGITVCISGYGLHHDQNLYPRPFEFIHDRFMPHPSEDGEKKTTAAVETSDNFTSWGLGKHACPGRFFAVDLVKIVVGKILLNYEVEVLRKRPDNVWFEYNVISPPSATLSVRRRKVPSVA